MKRWGLMRNQHGGEPSLWLSCDMNSPERSLAVMELRILSCWSVEASILPLLLEQTEPELSTKPSASSTSRSIRSLQGQRTKTHRHRSASTGQFDRDFWTYAYTWLWMHEKLTLHQDSCCTSFFQTGFVGRRSQTARTFSTCNKRQHIPPQSLSAPWEKQLKRPIRSSYRARDSCTNKVKHASFLPTLIYNTLYVFVMYKTVKYSNVPIKDRVFWENSDHAFGPKRGNSIKTPIRFLCELASLGATIVAGTSNGSSEASWSPDNFMVMSYDAVWRQPIRMWQCATIENTTETTVLIFVRFKQTVTSYITMRHYMVTL